MKLTYNKYPYYQFDFPLFDTNCVYENNSNLYLIINAFHVSYQTLFAEKKATCYLLKSFGKINEKYYVISEEHAIDCKLVKVGRCSYSSFFHKIVKLSVYEKEHHVKYSTEYKCILIDDNIWKILVDYLSSTNNPNIYAEDFPRQVYNAIRSDIENFTDDLPFFINKPYSIKHEDDILYFFEIDIEKTINNNNRCYVTPYYYTDEPSRLLYKYDAVLNEETYFCLGYHIITHSNDYNRKDKINTDDFNELYYSFIEFNKQNTDDSIYGVYTFLEKESIDEIVEYFNTNYKI